jgi:HEAT repeat protein
MPFLIEHITEVVLSIVVIVLLGTGALVAMAIGRRQRREKYFERLDDLRQRYGPIVAALYGRKIEYDRGLEALKSITGLDRLYFLEQLLLEKTPTAAQVPVANQLSEDLGLVKVWQSHVSGRFDVASLRDALARPEGILQRVGRLNFILKAKSAENLGVIHHQPSWPLLAKALNDPHVDVQSVAARALAAIGETESFPALLARLHDIIIHPSSTLSLRSIKSALVSFPLNEAQRLMPSLQHGHPRVRFMAVDIIREMVEREASLNEEFVLDASIFGPELGEILLTHCCFDDNGDVRARSAPIIAYLNDVRATPVLLTLLDDPQWFVRLHTVRALAKRKFISQGEQISQRLTDTHWLVREAAAQTLLVFGHAGVDQLADHMLSTQDRYSREQIADEMQRTGLIPTLLTQYATSSDKREARVLGQLADLGKTSYMLATLISSSDRNLRKKFLADFGVHHDPRIRAWVKKLATFEPDTEIRRVAVNMIGKALDETEA